MGKVMTLREAVEIDRKRVRAESLNMRVSHEKRERNERARAIVDAAVDAHEARCKHSDNECLSDDFIRGWDEEAKFKKLRALESGEDHQ